MALKWLGLLVVLLAGCSHQAVSSRDEGDVGIRALKIRGDGGFFGKSGKGTGVVVEGRYLITVAHNLCDDELGRVTAVEVRKKGAGAVERAKGWWASAAYRKKQERGGFEKSDPVLLRDDFGFIDLGSAVSDGRVFQLDRRMRISLQEGDLVEVAGYRGNGELQNSAGRVTRLAGRLFGYGVKTQKGMSGAPVWVERNGRKILVGIHVGSDLAGIKGAVARRIDRGMIEEFDQWVAKSAGRELR